VAHRLKKTVAEAFELPMDVMMDMPLIHMTGTLMVTVENHRGIVEYTDRKIRIDSAAGPIEITGIHMMIVTIEREQIVIRGSIGGIQMGGGR
jgi:sporulation protein YqfC